MGKNMFGVEKAKKILGENHVFGPEEWKRFFGDRVELGTVPQIPWNKDVLENPGLKQKHFLFLGADRLKGQRLSLVQWFKAFSSHDHPKFYSGWFSSHRFAQRVCSYRWYLMTVGIVEGSLNLSYERQVAFLKDSYEVPSVVERAGANILFYLLNCKYLDEGYWARVSDLTSGLRVLLQGFPENGLNINNWNDNANPNIGIGASRKFFKNWG